MSADKKEERRRVRELTALLGEDYLRECDRQIVKTLFTLREYALASTVFCYVSVGSEPDTTLIIERALRDGKTVAVPLVEGDTMTARVIYGKNELKSGTFGIPEPSNISEILPSGAIDIAIIPALTFDVLGNRLGHGGGYYDRYLAGASGVKIGLGREKLILGRLPCEAHDIPVDMLITEAGIRDFRENKNGVS